MEIKVSIIVPVYNTAQYLEKCIESLIDQTLKDIEIILVNDGSEDESPDICDYYAKKDNKIRYINLKKNLGTSIARNIGILNSRGEYIAFVDSDDFVERNMYEILYNNAKKTKADITICNFSRDWLNGKIEKNILKIKDEFVDTNNIGILKYFCKYWLGLSYANYIGNKLYKRDLFILSGVRFPIDFKFIEDRMLHYMLLPLIKKTLYINTSLYHYLQRPNSASYTQGNKENLFIHYLKVYFRTIDIWKKQAFYSELKKIFPVFLCRMLQGAIYINRLAGHCNNSIGIMLNQAINDNREVKKLLLSAAFSQSVTIYRKALGVSIDEEFKMRAFALACLCGLTGYKIWQEIYKILYS